MLRVLAILAFVAIPLFIGQADDARGGAKLYIYRGEELEGTRYSGTPEVVDLGGASGTPTLFVPIGDQTADTPVDPHSVAVRRAW